MNIFTSLKKSVWLIGLVLFAVPVIAQNITISSLTNGLPANMSTLVAGATNVPIFGIELVKNNVASNAMQSLTITFTKNPAIPFTNVRLYSSSDATFDAGDVTPANLVGTVTVSSSPDEIKITGSPNISGFGGGAAAATRRYFLVVDISSSVTAAAGPIQANVANAGVEVTTPAVSGGPLAGRTYNIAPLTTSITQLTTGVETGTLGSEDDNIAILGFKLTTNGPRDLTALTINTTSAATGKFTNIRLFTSSNDSYGGGDVSIATASSVTGSTIVFTGLSQTLVTGDNRFFIVADVDPSVNASTPNIELSFDDGDVTLTGGGIITAATITGEDYNFADETNPVATGRVPADNSTGISVTTTTAQLTLSENVQLVSGYGSDANHRIRLRTIGPDNDVETVSAGNISIAGNVVTITFTTSLTAGQQYAIYIGPNVFEDLSAAGNDFAGYMNNSGWVFTTEAAPNISGLVNTTRCIGDQLVINGTRFMGTGSTPGVNKPEVRINGTLVPDANVTAFTATSITLTVPSGVSTGNVVVKNMDNNVSSNGVSLTVHPQINTGLTVTPSTTSPAQNTSVNVVVGGTQNSYRYDLILTSRPAGYSVAPGTSVDDENGNSGNITLNTSEGADPDLTHIGSYGYRVDVSRTGCTTRTLTTTISLTVASLAVNVSATNTSVCNGSSSILIGSTSGGTGFYQFSWKGPNGFTNTSSSPSITPNHPSGTGWYVLTLSDNSSNKAKDSVFITTYPVPTASIVANPGETDVRDNYIVENRDYLVTGSPAGGVFNGQGIVKKSDGNFYFNPLNAGLGNWPIVYTYTDINGCQATDTQNFLVQALAVDGVAQLYCQSQATDSDIRVNLDNAIRTGYQFTRLRFYAGTYYDTPLASPALGTPPASGMPSGATYPLSITSRKAAVGGDIQTGLPVNLPEYYTLDLNAVRNGWGYGYYYIDVFGKDMFGNEVLQSWAFFNVVENGPVPAIIGIENQNICSSSAPIELSSSEPGYTITNFTMAQSAFAGSLTGLNNRDFNPGHPSLLGTDERNLTINMAYRDFNSCPNSVEKNFNWIRKPNGPITQSPFEYCQKTDGVPASLTISASPNPSSLRTSPNWYALDPASNPTTPVIDSVNFIFTVPGINGLLAGTNRFYVTQTYKGCEGATTPVDITIKVAPNASFTTPPICEDRDFTLIGPTEVGGVPYTTYEWDFDDGGRDTLFNDNQVTYNYGPNTASLFKKIKLQVTNSLGCKNNSVTNSPIGNNPVPKFTFQKVCESEVTEFSATTNITVASFAWDFGDLTPVVGPGAFQNINHLFASGAGDYNVKVTAYTGLGCFGSDLTTVSILKYLTYNTNNPYEMRLLEGGKGYWKVQDLKDSTTWEFNTPNKTIIQSSENTWVTNATGNYKANDWSVLNSPCLNITDIKRPVLSLNLIANTERDKDGASLEYSTNGTDWIPLGQSATGEQWFNTIFSSADLSEGWSGNIWDPEYKWVEAKHGLESIPLAQRNKIRLRMVFNSNNDRDRGEGFAFNNLAILPRNRFMLIENFTNQSDPIYTANNNVFVGLDTTEFVKLQYHLPFPAEDPINRQNSADPSARAAFYGISNDSQIFPRAFIDGGSRGNLTNNWYILFKELRSLKSSPFAIGINTLPSTNPNELTISASIKSLRDISVPFVSKPIVHLAIAEKTVGSNEFVLRKFLPDNLGTTLSLPMDKNDIFTLGPIKWNCTIDPNQIVIVAFIQDEVTKEVYQADFVYNPDHLPAVITSIEDTFAEQITIFPNPAQGEVNIQLPEKARHPMLVNLVDGFGREVYSNQFNVGEQTKKIYTSSYSGGMYILQIKAPNGKVARKKVMIVNE